LTQQLNTTAQAKGEQEKKTAQVQQELTRTAKDLASLGNKKGLG